MIRAITIELGRPSGGDIALGIHRPSNSQGAGKGGGTRSEPFREGNPEFVAHARPRGRIFQEETHHHQLSQFAIPEQLLVSTRNGPGAGVGREVPGCKGHLVPGQGLLEALEALPGIECGGIEFPDGLFRMPTRLFPNPGKVRWVYAQGDITSGHYILRSAPGKT